MSSLGNIEVLAKAYADAHTALGDEVRELEEETAKIKKRRLKDLRDAVATAAEARQKLINAIGGAPELFKKPRTLVLHGVKVGYAKGKGSITIADTKRSIELVRKHLQDQEKTLVKVEETLVKAALGNLTADQLKKIGATVTNATDQVVVKPTDSAIDKMVDALLKDTTDEAVEA